MSRMGALISDPAARSIRELRDRIIREMRSRSLKFGLLVIGVLSVSAPAFAWGPTTHIGLADSLLNQLGLLPAGIAALLARHAMAYLYGSIAADVVFAKRLSRIKQFCHHWSTGFRLLESAGDDRSRAFAYGYLSHLAADTVAHGKYVPRQIRECRCTVSFGHLYWEMRADAVEGRPTQKLLAQVLTVDHDVHHWSMAQHMPHTLLSYDANRALFNRINGLVVKDRFRRTMRLWSLYSRWDLSPDLLRGYRAESLDRIISLLREGQRSTVLKEDPNGTSAFMQLKVRRREQRRLAPVVSNRLDREAALSLLPASFRPPELGDSSSHPPQPSA